MTVDRTNHEGRASVLIVDDEPDILTALTDLLEADYRVLAANTAEEGLCVLKAHPEIALIISDQRMAGMSGDRFLAAARDISDAGAILITGYADLGAVVDAVNKGGILGYVPKPWDPGVLTGMVEATVERTRMARALDLERTLLHGLLESSADAVSFKDGEGRFVRLNSAKARLLQRDVDACLGLSEAEISGAAGPQERDRAVLSSGESDEEVLETPDPDRGSRFTMVSRTPLPGRNGRSEYLMTVERDITDSRLTEARLRQSEKMQALGTLAGGIAHDFNNLLTAIIGSLDLAERRLPDDPRLHRYVTGAREAAERGAVLTKRLLGFSRQTDQRRETSDVNAVVARMKDLLDHALGGTVRVDWTLSATRPLVRVDPEQLELAILNLCVNARDAMPEGGTVRIRTSDCHVAADNAEQLAPGRYVEVEVADEGCGMPPEVIARVFEPFFTTKELGKGTGLGLSMVYTLVNQAGGDVTIDSVLGSGTRVILRLPASGEEAAEVAAETDPPAPQVRSVRLFVVDDDPAVRAVTAAYASALGHAVQEAASGPEALAALEAGAAADLMVVDYAMPGMTGVELADRLRRLRPGLPVLYVTGHAEAEALNAMDHYLPKPFREEDLRSAIATVLVGETNG